ncbi:pentapeptide repeat-containing protein [Streptomyces sp. NPDC101213]|uniref:pentapeptide repeat-containing protein n=1 Tax=Streptomyces sp. NPDC101213 TaxID=3366130 RepID=UPI00380EB3A2
MTKPKNGVEEQRSRVSRRERSKLFSSLLGHWSKEESKRQENDEPLAYFPKPFVRAYVGLLFAGVVASVVAYAVLVYLVPGMDKDRADTLRTALLVVGGSGAVAALYASYRKQRTDEHIYIRDQDKLFTERYNAAAGQLGSEATTIRLAGVYALARIADDSKRDRPTSLSVLCAYLRLPYDPDDSNADVCERQVRITAQAIIAERLRSHHPGFWMKAEVNLRGACLIDAGFEGIEASSFDATGATFSGPARFDTAKFSHNALFGDAEFRDDAWFVNKVTFGGVAKFDGARFKGRAMFHSATFDGSVSFCKAKFKGKIAKFLGVTFNETVQFSGAELDHAGFELAEFFKGVDFGDHTTEFDERINDATFDEPPGLFMTKCSEKYPPRWPVGYTHPNQDWIVWF